MKIKSLAVVLAMLAGSPAMAACTETFDLGVMGPPGLRVLSNSFGSAQHFEDCYNFTLDGSADSFGFTLELDGSVRRDIDLGSVSLSGGNLVNALSDVSPSGFSFNNLLAGAYQFVITGDVTGRDGGLFGGGLVGYAGSLVTAGTSVAAPVPEPKTYALLALGLLVVGSVVRRRHPT